MSSEPASRGWLAVPAPLRSLFKIFPLRIYDPEALPYRCPDPSLPRPTLYVFTLDNGDGGGGSIDDRLSFNPSCLKWQALLRIAGVDVELVPSNNHASPSGALPFLLPADGSQALPLTGDKILEYAQSHSSYELPIVPNHRLDVYRALITQSIRPAWVRPQFYTPLKSSYMSRKANILVLL